MTLSLCLLKTSSEAENRGFARSRRHLRLTLPAAGLRSYLSIAEIPSGTDAASSRLHLRLFASPSTAARRRLMEQCCDESARFSARARTLGFGHRVN